MDIKISRSEAEKQIRDFFKSENIKNKTPEEVKKIKRLAANKKISIKSYRNLFCKDCLNPFSGNEKIRIKKDMKSTECLKCGKVNRIRFN